MKNINEELTEDKEISQEENQINEENISSSISNKNLPKKEIFSQVTRGDLLLFKEDILKSVKMIKNEIDVKISKKFEEYNKIMKESSQKLNDYETDKIGFLTKLNFIEEKNKIISKIEEIESKLKKELNVHSLNIETSQKDISNMRFKYDTIVTNNLLIPGIVGNMCKFSNLREYIINERGEISKILSNIRNLKDELKNTKNSVVELKDNFIKYKKENEINYQSFVNLKIEKVEQKLDNNLNSMINKISDARIENNIYVQNFLNKEKQLNDYLIKIEDFKARTLEDYKKINEKTKSLSDYTLSKLEKNLNEYINIKKSILELTNIFVKQKRAYGDDNLNENKREVIFNFGNMVNGLIKDLMNEKKKLVEYNFSNNKNEKEPNSIKESNKREYIDAKYNLNRNSIDRVSKHFFKKKTFNNFKLENNLAFIEENLFEKKNPNNIDLITSSIKLRNNSIKNTINEENNNKVNINNNSSSRFSIKKPNESIVINGDEKNEQNIIKNKKLENIACHKNKFNDNFTNIQRKNTEVLNSTYNINNNKKEMSSFNEKITSFNNFIPKTEEKKVISNKINKEINNLKSFTQENNSTLINNNLKVEMPNSVKKKTTSSPKNKKIILKQNINIKNNIIYKNNSKEEIEVYTNKKNEKTKEKEKKSLYEDTFNQKTINSNILKTKKLNSFVESTSQENNFIKNNQKIKDDIIINKQKKRPKSKIENFNRNKEINNISDFNSLNNGQKNLNTYYDLKYNKEIFFNKNIENEINYIKDKDIIDKPLLSNQDNFELIKESGGIEKKLLELEYFTKKKFDELVKEIKNFIPIHFNSHLKDYAFIDNKNKKK